MLFQIQLFPRNQVKRQVWLDSKCHELKHTEGAADNILDEMKSFKNKKLSKVVKENLDSSITYFENHKSEMNYAESIVLKKICLLDQG